MATVERRRVVNSLVSGHSGTFAQVANVPELLQRQVARERPIMAVATMGCWVRLRRGWWGIGGFHGDDTYDGLPPLPEHLFDGSFGWLTPQAAGPQADIDGAVPV
jgi:hypothetical protein